MGGGDVRARRRRSPTAPTITPKYLGSRRLVEVAVASLATDRALLLLGVPGTAKTWLGEHLAAAISGRSTLVVQGTAGHAGGVAALRLELRPPARRGALARRRSCPGPVMRAMETGAIVRIEELTRIPADVQDALITILSEKTLPVPELDTEVQARPGFNVIATANNRDKGVNDLSSALRRRFNTVVLPLPDTLEQEVEIVRTRVDRARRRRSSCRPTSSRCRRSTASSPSSASCARA